MMFWRKISMINKTNISGFHFCNPFPLNLSYRGTIADKIISVLQSVVKYFEEFLLYSYRS